MNDDFFKPLNDEFFKPLPQMSEELKRILYSDRWGGPVRRRDDYPEWVNEVYTGAATDFYQVIRRLKSDADRNNPREIGFRFTQSVRFNAFAYASPNDTQVPFDFIGITGGMVWTLVDLFNRILSDPKNFADVGNPSLEVAPPPIHLTPEALTSAEIRGVHIPNCGVRKTFAGLLVSAGLNHAFCHEATHLLNGHVDFIREHFSHRILDEDHASGFSSDLLTRQALEMDADGGGAVFSTQLGLEKAGAVLANLDKYGPEPQSALQAAFGSPERWVFFTAFAVYMVFRNFDIEWHWWKQDEISHPAYAIRMKLALEYLNSAFERTCGSQISKAEIVRLITLAMSNAEAACARLTGAMDVSMLQSVSGNAESEKYVNSLRDRLVELQPKLALHRRNKV